MTKNNSKKICLIGNNGFGKPVFDGQRIKVRTYKTVLESEGFNVELIELDKPLRNLLGIFSKIKKGIKANDIIVLIASDNGERVLIPYINRINRKYKKRFIFSQIGTSFLFPYIKNMTEDQKRDFFHNHNFLNYKPKTKTVNNLKKIDVILTETQLINDTFSAFFGLDNCHFITNFRFVKQPSNDVHLLNNKLMYLSRVTTKKGIFDLINVVTDINKNTSIRLSLDIFGTIYLSKGENDLFKSLLSDGISYCGELNQDDVLNTIQKYDFLCFPTKCEGEGTPGCIIESLIAGVPVVSSDFTQSDELLTSGVDSIVYDINNSKNMKDDLINIYTHKDKYNSLRSGAYISGSKFTYFYNRENFLQLIRGENDEK